MASLLKFEVTRAPDFKGIAKALRKGELDWLAESALIIINDCTTRIRRGLKLDGSKQQQNVESTRKRKQREYGHSTPLVGAEQVLVNADNWRVNGVTLRARPIPKIGGKRKQIVIRLPQNRVEIAKGLESRGYEIPFGVSTEAEEQIMKAFEQMVSRALQGQRG